MLGLWCEGYVRWCISHADGTLVFRTPRLRKRWIRIDHVCNQLVLCMGYVLWITKNVACVWFLQCNVQRTACAVDQGSQAERPSQTMLTLPTAAAAAGMFWLLRQFCLFCTTARICACSFAPTQLARFAQATHKLAHTRICRQGRLQVAATKWRCALHLHMLMRL
jgi:hypothetical protein